MKIAILGADASGLYTADVIMRCATNVQIDIYTDAIAPAGLGVTTAGDQRPTTSQVRIIGNVTTTANKIAPFYDAVIDASYTTAAPAHAAVAGALAVESSPRPATALAGYLRAHHPAHTLWNNALTLPTDRDLVDWELVVLSARDIPVCF